VKRVALQRRHLRARSDRAEIVSRLDALCRELVFRRDRGVCIFCRAEGLHDPDRARRIQWCHVHSRAIRSLRWNPLNSFAACAGHHLRWHARPVEMVDRWRAIVSPATVERLAWLAASPQKVDLALTECWLRAELAMGGSGA